MIINIRNLLTLSVILVEPLLFADSPGSQVFRFVVSVMLFTESNSLIQHVPNLQTNLMQA